MTLRISTLAFSYLAWFLSACSGGSEPPDAEPLPCEQDRSAACMPQSDAILGVRLDLNTLVERAPGSDNWAVTWADDGAQFVTWGDGGGFGGTDQAGRASMGVAEIEGELEDFTAKNVWGGKGAPAEATFTGKSYGILALGPELWLWRTGEQSTVSAFLLQDLFVSRDNGRTFEPAGVSFTPEDFESSRGFFAPTFLQFGQGYRGALDRYVYIYAPEIKSEEWDVQVPGEITLMRVPAEQLGEQAAYEFFTGRDSRGAPSWTSNVAERTPVFRDPVNGVMLTSVTYNAGLGRFLLITQHRSRQRGGYIGIYESGAPWGPWKAVLFDDAWEIGLQDGGTSVFWNFSNKWTSRDGRHSALIYTGPGSDNFGVVMVEFETR